jgi:hypothetical protein
MPKARFAHAIKPMTPAAREKGRQFVASLMDEGHNYHEMLNVFRTLVALEALSRENNSSVRAGKRVGVSGAMVRDLMKLAGVKKSAVLEERASA